MRLKRFFIEFAYNGEAYHGWQRQTNALTVQAVMEDCFGKLLKTKICLTGAGRTDTGVHAKQMFAHFDTNKIFKINDLTHLANNFLPIDIRIKSINQVKNEAHARFSALERSYEYHVSNLKDPFNFSFHYYLKILPNLDIMNKAAKILVDYKNFILKSSMSTSSIIISRNSLGNVRFKKVDQEDYLFKCDLLKKGETAFNTKTTFVYYRINKNNRSANKLKNFVSLWQINKTHNKLDFFTNLKSLFFISINSLIKYGWK